MPAGEADDELRRDTMLAGAENTAAVIDGGSE